MARLNDKNISALNMPIIYPERKVLIVSLSIFLSLFFLSALFGYFNDIFLKKTTNMPIPSLSDKSWGMKLVNENVTDQELDAMKSLGITLLGGEWGMEEADPSSLRGLLDRVNSRGMKWIVNFSDEAGWGYGGGDSDSPDVAPNWQAERVKKYLQALGEHPAIFGYDISNEAGENLPNGDTYRITLEQMRQAANDIRTTTPGYPVMIRMHDWDETDEQFGANNPFGPDIADIVMLNIYSNYSDNGDTALFPDIVRQRGQIMVDAIKKVDPKTKVFVALGAFRELPKFIRPSSSDLERDIKNTLALQGVSNISFFGWGPERYPETPPGWYLPRDGKDLIDTMAKFTH